MLRSSFCTIAFQENKWGRDRTVERPVTEILPILADAGFDGVELWEPHVAGLAEAELAEVEQQLAETGLRVAMLSPYFDFTTSPASAAASVEHGRRALDLARRLGARAIRCFTGKTGSADATDEAWDRAVASLATLADASAADGIFWALETHSRNLMDTIESSRTLVERVGRENLRLILQPSTFKDAYLEATRRLAPLAIHVHASNRTADGERALLGEGVMDWAAIARLLAEADFDGYISVEWMGPDPAAVARAEGPYLASCFADL